MQRDYDVIEDGEVVLSVRHLWPAEPVECCICGNDTHSRYCVAYYCEPVRDDAEHDGGYLPACEPCYRLWVRWTESDSTLGFRRWCRVNRPPVLHRPAHGGYPGEVTSGVKGEGNG